MPIARVLRSLSASLLRPQIHARSHALTLVYDPPFAATEGANLHNTQPALGPLTASQPSEGPASPKNIPTDDAAPPGGHHIPSSGENPMSPAEAAEPAILGGF